ncbi:MULTISPECIES: hypothetical protein [Halorubrum]|jgi:hypothetical protein|uniref:Uncharacterized protein n=1 Tax=Halorubrum tropicale TaxID=1765655 RepID=A0A0N1IV05_9EURY|nr:MULTISPECIES: hypothetical protein [Halorubrum]KOX97226.1 hypothetical protein AMR74_07325 [Halorubrum tropicale]TKX42535.1 hypothetical protein EXE50_13895 [Halorubrum sp. ARQ200]TKX49925.1 hypothetical protein EXE49_09000 [Halorubrum sp. ASP121]
MADASGPSVAARDDLAGVVDLFGWLTRAELSRALSELAFKQRAEVDEAAIDAAIDLAVAEYALVPAPSAALSSAGSESASERETALAVGPAAFPTLPAGAEDLPHILEIPDREVDREALSDAVLERLREEAVAAIGDSDDERLETLADVTYDVEAWAPVDVDPVRTRILAEVDEA